jgi:hypothetical protein
VAYATLEDILADRELGLSGVQPTTEAVRRAIDNRLRDIQLDSADSKSNDYMRLVVARAAISKIDGNENVSRELAAIPISMFEKAIAIIGWQAQNSSKDSSAEERMRIARSLSVMRASEDFRNYRVYPLAGVGTLLAFVLGAMQAATAAWNIVILEFCLGILMILAFLVLFIARIVQGWDEETLFRLFDPDIQAIAIRRVGLDRSFTRTEFRNSLMCTADEQVPVQWSSFIRYHPWPHESEDNFLEEAPHNDGPQLRQFLRIGRVLTTVDIMSALEEAAELAIMRYAEMGLLDSAQELGVTTFTVQQTSAVPGRYTDSADSGCQRYWAGTAWTPTIRATPPGSDAMPRPPVGPAGGPETTGRGPGRHRGSSR